MLREKRFSDSKEALFVEGVGMAAFGAVAFCYTGPELQKMLIPIGMLLVLNGAARLLLSAWYYDRGTPWRRLLQQSGCVDALTGAAALSFGVLNIPALIEIFATWLILSGYFHLRRFLRLKEKRPGSTPLAVLGLLSVGAGGLLWSNILMEWLHYPYLFSVTALLLGLSKIYAFFKLGKRRGCLSTDSSNPLRKEKEQRPRFSELNLN